MKFKYIGKEDTANGLKTGDIKDCGVETFVFGDHKSKEYISIYWHNQYDEPSIINNESSESIFTFKHYKSFRDLFEEWEEVGCR